MDLSKNWPHFDLTVSLQKWSGSDQFFDSSVPNFLCCVNMP